MSLPIRESPISKPVSLFVTCIVDIIYPDTGMSVVEVLEHLGIEVDFPMAQTCCGQPAFNSGYRDEAKSVAKQFLKAFEGAQIIVTPSGSCAALIRHDYPTLFADEPDWEVKAKRAAAITWEFSEYLVDGLGVTDLGARLSEKRTIALHDACHGLRLLKLKSQARALLSKVENAELTDLTECDMCCGFGGLFAIKMADVSGAMLERKVGFIEASSAQDIITGDASCLMQMNGGLTRQKSTKRVRHLADILAEGLKK